MLSWGCADIPPISFWPGTTVGGTAFYSFYLIFFLFFSLIFSSFFIRFRIKSYNWFLISFAFLFVPFLLSIIFCLSVDFSADFDWSSEGQSLMGSAGPLELGLFTSTDVFTPKLGKILLISWLLARLAGIEFLPRVSSIPLFWGVETSFLSAASFELCWLFE